MSNLKGGDIFGMTKTERILWNYRKNVKKMTETRAMLSSLMSVRGANYEAHTGGGVSEPVFEVVSRILKAEKRLAGLERQVQAVEELALSLVVEELDTHQMGQILKHRYILHMEPEAVMRKVGMTKPTYYRRSRELLKRAEEYM